VNTCFRRSGAHRGRCTLRTDRAKAARGGGRSPHRAGIRENTWARDTTSSPACEPLTRQTSGNTVNAALRRLGYSKVEMTGHGFRAMARTILDEVLGMRPDFIEHQLAHSVRDPLGRAHNRTTHLAERRDMQRWAAYLDGLKNDAEVVPLHGKLA
jgi:integrase